MIKLIVAKGLNNEIGKNNDLLWHLPADMQFFKQATMGHIVIMGRKNWESIPQKFRPLPGRTNVVISRNKGFNADGCTVFNSLEEAIRFYESEPGKDIFLIGGGQIYKQAMEQDLADELLVTEVEQAFDADTWFPEIAPDKWLKECILRHEKDAKNAYNFKVWKYTRKKN
jgi:dihydrofolate reductase